MDTQSLQKLLAVLQELRVNTAEPCAVQSLDEAIRLIEAGIEKGEIEANTSQQIISLLGEVFAKLPSIKALIELLSG